MKEPSLTTKILVVAGLLFSTSAVAWLALMPVNLPMVLDRFGFISAFFCAAVTLMFCWGASAAYVARKLNWSPRACYMLGACFFGIPGLACAFFGDPPFSSRGTVLLCLSTFAGIVCRKLAYPELTDDQATAPPPPLTLFPK